MLFCEFCEISRNTFFTEHLLSTGYSTKKSIHNFFGTALKSHEHTTCIDFQFHNLKFSQKGVLDFSVITATVDMYMKEVIDNLLRRAL